MLARYLIEVVEFGIFTVLDRSDRHGQIFVYPSNYGTPRPRANHVDGANMTSRALRHVTNDVMESKSQLQVERDPSCDS